MSTRSKSRRASLRGLGRVEHHERADEQPLDDEGPGAHVWIMAVVYRMTPMEAAGLREATLDAGRILTSEGPGCWRCEAIYSPELQGRACPGAPPGELRYVTPGAP